MVTRELLDSSSQGSSVNKALSTDALTDHREKTTPTTMIMVDGHDSPAGPITQHNPVKIDIASHEEPLTLDTASLFHSIILEMPWHKRHNPKIDYLRNTMTFDSNYCHANCRHYGTTVPLHPKDRSEPETQHSETQTRKKTKTKTPKAETDTQRPRPQEGTPRQDPNTQKLDPNQRPRHPNHRLR